MSFFIGPNTPMSYTGQIISDMCIQKISIEEATQLFCDDNPGTTIERLKVEFQKIYNTSECNCSSVTKKGIPCRRRTTREKGKCRQHQK
jgi:hypothetical protein